MKAAYLGMGNMGVRMAPNLHKAGFEVSVWSRRNGSSWPNVEKLIGLGLHGTDDMAEAVKGARFVGMCVTNDIAVLDVVEKVMPHLEPGTILLDHSTIAPQTATRIAAMLKEVGVLFLDAPISGGEKGAADGTLTIMIGGEKEAFEAAAPYLQPVSRHAVYMGESGTGSITKLINQHLAGINQAVVCEAVIMANQAKINLESLYTVVNNSWGRSFAFERIVLERLANQDFYPTYAPSEMMNKDLHHVLELAADLGCDAPYARLTSSYFEENVAEGRGKWDHSSIIINMAQRIRRQDEGI